MNAICESVRDDVPLLAAGMLDDARAREVTLHVAECASCRAESDLVALLRTVSVAAVGLESRVLRAIAIPAPPPRWRVGALAAAAGLVALIGGSAVLLQSRSADGPDVVAVGFEPELEAAELSWAARTDPLLHGGPGLAALSDEELELLLQEMES